MRLRASAFDFHQHTSQEVVVYHLPCIFCCEGGVHAVDSWKKKRIEGWRLARVATLQILNSVVVVAITYTDHLWSYTDRWGQSIGFGNFEAAKSSLFSIVSPVPLLLQLNTPYTPQIPVSSTLLAATIA